MASKAVRPGLKRIYSKEQQEFYDRLEGGREEPAPAAAPPKDPAAAARKRRQGIARLMELAGRRRGQLAGAVVLAVFGAAVRLAPFVLVYYMFGEAIAHWNTLGDIDGGLMAALALGAVAAAVVYGLAQYLSTMLAHVAAFNILYELRVQLMGKLARVPSGFFTFQRQGEVSTVLNSDVEQIEGFVAHQLSDAASAISLPLVTLAFLFTIDWRFSLALVVPLVLALVFLGGALKTPEGVASQEAMRASKERMNGTIVEYVHGMPVVKVFNRSLKAFKRFEADARARTGNIKWATFYSAPSMGRLYAALGTQVLFLVLATILVLPTVEPTAEGYARFLPTVFLFFLMGSGMKESVTQMLVQAIQLTRVNAAVARIDGVLDYPELARPERPLSPQDSSLAFEKVSFSYEGARGVRALDEVSFRLAPGSVTGLVGPSGGGKSTIAALILRFFDAQEGSVKVGGVDVRDVDPDSLGRYVSFVSQDSFMLADTLEANVRMGNAAATREEVMAALRAAQIDEVVERLPQGLATRIGPGGEYLSGGEEQRLAIARVFLRNAPIVVLDEATSYADAENEAKIQRAFAHLAEGKTVLVIAHRLKTVEAADSILMMDGGRLVAQGPHDELLKASPGYRAMLAANEMRESWELRAQAGAPGGDAGRSGGGSGDVGRSGSGSAPGSGRERAHV